MDHNFRTDQIIIDDAKADDVFGIRAVQKNTWFITYPSDEFGITLADIESRFREDDTLAGQQAIAAKKERFLDPTQHTWVARHDSQIVGFVWAQRESDINKIQALYVLPDYHGLGLGRQLITLALQWLGSAKDVSVNVAAYNQKAIGFYERMGFVKTNKANVCDPASRLPSGKIIPEIEMVKKA
jgi:ribosomal protein S18 acetylase RimI-like enzyme